jgi:CopG antitoxin of type II toxin-antitoxin system
MIKPTVDLGHPTPSQGNIPAFQSIEEEADFWDTHDVTDFIDDTPVVPVTTASNPESRDE